MKDQDLTMEKHNTDRYKLIKQNNNYRYHYLHENNDFQVPELVLDFKQYFTAPRNILYERIADCYLASIAEIFREDLSQRFGYYLSRIGLPEIREAGIT